MSKGAQDDPRKLPTEADIQIDNIIVHSRRVFTNSISKIEKSAHDHLVYISLELKEQISLDSLINIKTTSTLISDIRIETLNNRLIITIEIDKTEVLENEEKYNKHLKRKKVGN